MVCIITLDLASAVVSAGFLHHADETQLRIENANHPKCDLNFLYQSKLVKICAKQSKIDTEHIFISRDYQMCVSSFGLAKSV